MLATYDCDKVVRKLSCRRGLLVNGKKYYVQWTRFKSEIGIVCFLTRKKPFEPNGARAPLDPNETDAVLHFDAVDNIIAEDPELLKMDREYMSYWIRLNPDKTPDFNRALFDAIVARINKHHWTLFFSSSGDYLRSWERPGPHTVGPSEVVKDLVVLPN